jgi:membrane-associated phospholipid phosphatase
MRQKSVCGQKRPFILNYFCLPDNNGFKTILGTPNFPAYTSGHSTFSSAAAEVLSYFFTSEATQFRKWAEEAAMSRVYGGIHYRFDAITGLSQGKKVGTYSVNRAILDRAETF